MSSMLSRNLSRFKVVTFDVTDTLMKFSKPPGIQYIETAKTFGITTINHDKVAEAFKKNFKRLSNEYPNFGYNSDINWHEWWRLLVVQTLNDSSSVKLDENVASNVATTLIKQYETPLCWTKFSRADELIQNVKEANKCVGIISNFDIRLTQLMKNMNFSNIDFVVTSYEAGVMKPNSEIFNKALSKSETFALPHEALHIGNEIELDCKGALDAGWSGVLIRNCERNKTKESKIQCPMYDTIDVFLDTLHTKELFL